MITNTILIGYGEVGAAHYKVLKKKYQKIYYKDKEPQIIGPDGMAWHPNGQSFDLMLVATQCNPKDMAPFYDMVKAYAEEYRPKIIDVLTTTPPGTCDEIQERTGISTTKSSIRGMHPNLERFLVGIPKHVGGNDADTIAGYYRAAGIEVITHKTSRTVEFAHIANNITYKANILVADELSKVARHYGIDWLEILKYRETNNIGFTRMGHPSKVSPLIMPLNGAPVGGHCVNYALTTIPDNTKGPMLKLLQENGNP